MLKKIKSIPRLKKIHVVKQQPRDKKVVVETDQLNDW